MPDDPKIEPHGFSDGLAATVAVALFDVHIVGGERLDRVALMKVADLIASRYRLQADAVANGLSGGACLVGARLTEPSARKLAEEVGDLGARTQVIPAGAKLSLVKRAATRDGVSPRPRRPSSFWLGGGAQPTPLKRAFLGLALALVVGFVPAAYQSLGVTGAQVRRIRARQLELSAQPGTKSVVDEFDRLEVAVSQARVRGLAQIIWVLVSGITGAGLARWVDRDRASRAA
jgi:hypothetical protein